MYLKEKSAIAIKIGFNSCGVFNSFNQFKNMEISQKTLLKLSVSRNKRNLIYIFHNNVALIFRFGELPTNIIREVHYLPQLCGDLFSGG